jgi:hypothetical protein
MDEFSDFLAQLTLADAPRGVPQSPQNFLPTGFSVPRFEQRNSGIPIQALDGTGC